MFWRGFNFSFKGDLFTLVICVTLSITLLALPDRSQIVVADSLNKVLTAPYWKTRNFGEDVVNTSRQNAWLKKRVAQLELMVATGERMQRDSERLAGPGLDPGYEGELVPCQVVMRQSGRFSTMLKIRSLEPCAWEPWLPVTSSAGYLGRVKTVINEHEAWVELMAAPDFALGVEFEGRDGLLGILRPRGDKFFIDMVSRDEDVRVGDRIITSGIAEIKDELGDQASRQLTPRGFPVATVSSVATPKDKIFKEISADPLASFEYNVTVFVVLPLEGRSAGSRGQP